MKKTGLYVHFYNFLVGDDSNDVAITLYTHKYLVVKNNLK